MGPLKRLARAQDAIGQMQQFPHHRGQGDHLGFATGEQPGIERLEQRIEAHGIHGGEVQGTAHRGVATFGQRGGTMQRTARVAETGTQADGGHQIEHIGKAANITEFGQQDGSGRGANADNGEQEGIIGREGLVSEHVLHDLFLQGALLARSGR